MKFILRIAENNKTDTFLIKCFDIITDGVAVVIYNMMNTFAGISHNGDPIPYTQVILK